MKSNPEKSKPERERQDWGIVLIILLLGFLCMIVSAQWALRFSPSWQVDANMESNLDLNSEFLTSRPVGFFEPIDADILTQPVWGNGLSTSGRNFITRTPLPPPPPTVPTEPETIAIPTGTVAVTNTGTTAPTNTFVWLPLPATSTRKPKDPPADTPPGVPNADLVVTIANTIASYSPGTSTTYTIQVTNNGPDGITGATVTDNFSAPINSVGPGGTCAPVGIGAACGTWSGAGNINDTVNLPAGTSVIYTVPVTTNSWYLMDLVNQASVTTAGYSERAPGNETADYINSLAISVPGDIWSPPDGGLNDVSEGGSLILSTSINLPPGGHPGPDLVYYEEPVGGDIWMDWVVIQIGNGTDMYTILNWGDYGGGGADTNTNVDVTVIGSTEWDNRDIPQSLLYPQPGGGTGVTIDLESAGVPPGTYTYLRIFAPPGDADGGLRMDAIEILP